MCCCLCADVCSDELSVQMASARVSVTHRPSVGTPLPQAALEVDVLYPPQVEGVFIRGATPICESSENSQTVIAASNCHDPSYDARCLDRTTENAVCQDLRVRSIRCVVMRQDPVRWHRHSQRMCGSALKIDRLGYRVDGQGWSLGDREVTHMSSRPVASSISEEMGSSPTSRPPR